MAATAKVTLTGSNPATAGDHTYTCAGEDCDLDASTTYFAVSSTADAETLAPTGNGWSIANAGRSKSGNSAWAELSSSRTGLIKVAAVDEPLRLRVSSLATTTATLSGHTGNWWLKKTAPSPAWNCVAGEADFSRALSSFTAGQSHTYSPVLRKKRRLRRCCGARITGASR